MVLRKIGVEMRYVRLAAVLAAAAALSAIALPLAAQTPTPGPAPAASAAATATGGPGLTFPTLTPTATATPNPLAPYAPFLLTAMLQGSDLPAGDITFLQSSAGPGELDDAFSDIGVKPLAGILQTSGPIVDASAVNLFNDTAPLFDGVFVGASPADATAVLTAVRTEATSYIAYGENVSDVAIIPGFSRGDEAVEASATLSLTDEESGDTVEQNAVLIAMRSGSVFYLVEAIGDGNQRATAEALAVALDAHVMTAVPLLPAP
jgi:hypothetical protein